MDGAVKTSAIATNGRSVGIFNEEMTVSTALLSQVLKDRPTAPSSRRRAAAVGEAGARIAMLGSENPDPGVYPTVGPCISASLQRILGLSRGLQFHGVPPLQWLEQ